MFSFFKKTNLKKIPQVSLATILVIDDSEIDRTLIKRILEKKQYTVITSVNGEEGIERACKGGIDLIILDNYLPGARGLKVCEILKGDSRTRHIPLVFLTVTSGGDVIHFYEAGADSYLHKPINPNLLLNEVKLLLEEARSKK